MNIFIQITQWLNVALALIVLLISSKYKREVKEKKNHKINNICSYYRRQILKGELYMEDSYDLIGKSINRVDAVAKVTGRAKYCSDYLKLIHL